VIRWDFAQVEQIHQESLMADTSQPVSTPRPARLNRRSLLLSAGAAGILSGVGAPASSAAPAKASPEDGPSVIAATDTGLLEVTGGQIAGYIRKGIYTYKGIPYAAPTSGANRFQAPAPVVPWQGIRSSRHWGPFAPQTSRNDGRTNDEESFMFDWNDATHRVYSAGQGEDCLCLNVWTPAINDGKRRPVLFWIHGGGFANGSGNEQPGYDGENLARRGDAVVVSVNHRLNVFGFLDLSAYGDEFKDAANAGMLDLVAALRWVRDNIAKFGGDPGCVTIFGQSGGGSKTGTLMAMPEAKGLFHRAIVQSGSSMRVGLPERSRRLADEVVAELGLSRATIQQIRNVPLEELQRAASKVLQAQSGSPAAERLNFGPVLDGVHIPAHPFDPKASELSADVPMMVGSTLNEFTTATNHPEYARMTEAQLEERVRAAHPERAARILEVFRKQMPGSTPFQRWSVINTVAAREGAIRQCTAKAALGKAPAYLYWFTWQTPLFEGRPGAFHCAEIAFVFDNTDRCDSMTGGGARPRALAARMSEAWLHFARTGNPNHAGIPAWKPFDPATVPTMIFDDRTRLELDPDGAERSAAAKG
jgi:para-nitrobenzyl esterase